MNIISVSIAMFVTILSLCFFVELVHGKFMDIDTQLKIINKPAIKSFQTEYGDTIDCVEIHKQLAFDHPFLKNHKIQMKPKTFPKETGIGASTSYKSSNYMPKNINCPPNSIPIKRAKNEDLVIAKSMKLRGINNVDSRGHKSAVLGFKHQIYGSKARINIWNPAINNEEQFSLGAISMESGPSEYINRIQSGWIVHSSLSPNASRLYTFWTGDGYKKTGCYNHLCPGFVQVSTEITLGLVLPPSTFNGRQTDMLLSIYQDRPSEYWWLMFEDKFIGYWPKVIIPRMSDGARFVSWGGEIYSPINVPRPVMGSGHFPEEGYSKSAYMTQIKVIIKSNLNKSQFEDPVDYALGVLADAPSCYNAKHGLTLTRGWGHFVYFGGPGKCTIWLV